ncbi:MAG: hypothetical protein M3253_02780, partial [Chloroflexota bacterium]|nr:hypothetical protein [Chloroflexota bacterium]
HSVYGAQSERLSIDHDASGHRRNVDTRRCHCKGRRAILLYPRFFAIIKQFPAGCSARDSSPKLQAEAASFELQTS